jgi:Protein of unknown function (DUF3800)
MSQTYNVYCDESCHLENDHHKSMVLGAVWCPIEKVKEISIRLREIKQRHQFKPGFEIKWTKISPAKLQFSLDLVDYFFDDDDLHFRGLVIPDKSKLDHQKFDQDHDDWYYKMYFTLIKVILDPTSHYRIYLDIKDTKSADKVVRLHDILCNNMFDFSKGIVERVQNIRSHEVEILQLTDLLTGALSYVNRDSYTSTAKQAIVERIKERSGYTLTKSTLYRENKVNLFYWQPSEV